MERIINSTEQERRAIFLDTAQKTGMPAAMVEKDFWVCWVLGKIFSDTALQKLLCFKGGTSLSKVFHVIERFSEDIDLILDHRVLLKDDEIIEQASKSKQEKFNREINERAKSYIATELKQKLEAILKNICEVGVAADDGHILNIIYPRSLTDTYIRPEIKLEVGPLAAWNPNDKFPISSYVAQTELGLGMKDITVTTIRAERTFWEKVTILHAEHYRPETSKVPPRYSRHYYDLYKMGNSTIKDVALSNFELLEEVVKFKKCFYPSSWANYDLAQKGSVKLFPSEHNLNYLEVDYKAMKNMIFGSYPDWEEILKYIKELESEIND